MEKTCKISTELPDRLVSQVNLAVSEGRYAKADAVITEALEVWTKREKLKAEATEYLRALIQEGIDSGPGREIDFEDMKAQLHAEFERQKDSRRVA